MGLVLIIGQAAAGGESGPSASAIFYLSLLFIFATAIVTAVATKWARDKCLKFFHRYHVTLERNRGQTIWGCLKVFSSGVEVLYDHPYANARGHKKTSFMLYQQEMDQQLLSVLRYADELDEQGRQRRRNQIQRTFNPGPSRRLYRGMRNLVNTLRDAFNAAIGTAVGQYQRLNPASAVLSSQAGSVTSIGQTLLGKFANAYEPLLEQYIGQPVILDVADPINPNNATVEYAGYLADYTQNFIAVFNVEHQTAERLTVTLPDVEAGEVLPPLPGPPPPGAMASALPPPLKEEVGMAVRMDGHRMKIQNRRQETVVVRRLEREGLEPIDFGMILPVHATLDLPARDVRGGTLILEAVRCLDIIASRKFAAVRHAGELVERPGIADEFHLDQLPRIIRLK